MEQEPGSWAGSGEVVISDGTTKGYHLRLFHFYPQDPVTLGIPGTRKPSGAEEGEHCEDAAVILGCGSEIQLAEMFLLYDSMVLLVKDDLSEIVG